MIAGTVLGMIIFVVIPLLWIMRWCLFSYKGFGTVKFVGLKNFIRVFSSTSSKYWLSVGNTFVFAIGKLLVEIPLALVLAFILTKKIRGRDFFRSVSRSSALYSPTCSTTTRASSTPRSGCWAARASNGSRAAHRP